MARCPDCNGSKDVFGLYGDGVCSHCHGDGKKLLSGLNEAIMGEPLDCSYCEGSGECQTCGGSGEVPGQDHEFDQDYRQDKQTSDEKSEPFSSGEESAEIDHYSEESSDDHYGSSDSNFSSPVYHEQIQKSPAVSVRRGHIINHRTDHVADNRKLFVKADHRKDHRK